MKVMANILLKTNIKKILHCNDAIFDYKDTNFDSKYTILYDEDAYYYYDIDVDRILSFKSGNKYFLRYKNTNKMGIVRLQLKFKKICYEKRNYGSSDNIIYIENSHEGFFGKMRKIWNKITKLIGINNAEDFIQYTLDNNSKYIEANILKNTKFVKDHCCRD